MRQNILFISMCGINPFDTTFGGSQRSNLLLNACSQVGDVDIIAFYDGVISNKDSCHVLYSEFKPNHFEPDSRLKKWIKLFMWLNPYSLFPIDKEKENIVDDAIAKKHYDVIVVRYLPEAMACGLLKYADRLIIDIDDHPKDMFRQKAKRCRTLPNKIYFYICSSLSHAIVHHLSNRIKMMFFSNPEQVCGKHGVFLPNISFYESSLQLVSFEKTNQRLFFVGRLDHIPNYQGLDHFIDNIWPLVRKELPCAELNIAGKIEIEEVVAPYIAKWNKIAGITVLGYVEDIDREYEQCRATIAPIYEGAGTNIKLLESLQNKRVCVTTKIGMRGMKAFFENNEDVFIANNDKDFARKIVSVLIDEKLNHRLASNGYKKYRLYFSRQRLDGIIISSLKN